MLFNRCAFRSESWSNISSDDITNFQRKAIPFFAHCGARSAPKAREDTRVVKICYQNFRFFFTASRFSSWMCSVRGMSFGQTSVQENWV